ncbi:hypothetical protein J2T56_001977 [Natronobacillus azotifigens]
MHYFFLEETIYNVAIIIVFILLVGLNSLFLTRVKNVKVKALQTSKSRFIPEQPSVRLPLQNNENIKLFKWE